MSQTLSALSSFADLHPLLEHLPSPDPARERAARRREAELTKPLGALGRLEDVAAWLAAWQGAPGPRAERVRVLVFAANHGVTAQGVSPYPSDVTAQMVANFAAGGAAINQLCRTVGAELEVVPLELERPTRDLSLEPAMDEAECVAAIRLGMDKALAAPLPDLLCPGDMGIGNTTAAAAICYALFGGEARDWAGPGTGLDEAGVAHKAGVVERAVARERAALGDPLEVLRRLGGRELAATFGALLAARLARIPALLDGYVVGAAAAVLHALAPGGLDHCLAGHRSAEPAHRALLDRLGKTPLLDLGMRLGEGSGAALAAALVRAAVATHTGMATFAEAGVSTRDD